MATEWGSLASLRKEVRSSHRKVKERKWKKVKSFSRVRLLVTRWTVAHQAALSVGFSRQEYWSRLPFPSPGDLPDPGMEPRSPALRADTLTSEPPGDQNKGRCYKKDTVLLVPAFCNWILYPSSLPSICQQWKRLYISNEGQGDSNTWRLKEISLEVKHTFLYMDCGSVFCPQGFYLRS